MRLLHHSRAFLERVYDADQSADALEMWFKPVGLWVTVPGDDDWPSWCRDSDFHIDCLTHATEVVLRPDARVLVLDTEDGVVAFNSDFGHSREMRWVARGIDWVRVASLYQGIVIAPHQSRLRLKREFVWYSTWDCASGCIWDAKAVRELRPVVSSGAGQLLRQGENAR